MRIARRDLVVSAAVFLALIRPCWLWAGEIHDAARDGKLEKVKSLLEADASLVSAKAKGDWTPLHYVALNCQKTVVEFLVTKGADLGAKAESGDTPLHCAVMGSNLLRDKGAVEPLLAKGADVNARNKEGETPLTFAGKEVAELLLKAKADINAKNKVGRTKLHREVVNGDKDMVAFLLSKDADAAVEDKNGISALDLAVLDVKIDIAAMLRQRLLAVAAVGRTGGCLWRPGRLRALP
jgi:ankyrin repeat protein